MPDDEIDIAEDIKQHIEFGRPNLPDIFEEMYQNAIAAGETTVGVLTCGPVPMVEEVLKLSYSKSDHKVRFEASEEIFEF